MPSGKTIAARTAPAPKTMPLPPFIIGVWYQPVSSFPKWKARGINTLVGIELENGGQPGTPAQQAAYIKAAHDAGIAVIGNHPDADAQLNGPDEPDGGGSVTPDAYVASYAKLKSAAPGKLVFGNFDGEKSRWRAEADYVRYFQGADLVGIDWYPCNRGMVPEGGFAIYADRVAWAVRIAAGKPVLVFIECSDQNMRVQDYLHAPENQPIGEARAAAMRSPTPAEMVGEANTAVAAGAKGVIYFPQKIGKNWEAFDVTPDDNAATMTAWNVAQAKPAPAPAPAPLPAKGPLDGKTMLIDGFTYGITSK